MACLAGEALVDFVRNDVGDGTPVPGQGEILLADQLLARGDIPDPEFGPKTPSAEISDRITRWSPAANMAVRGRPSRATPLSRQSLG
jgi:hypothetical protein